MQHDCLPFMTEHEEDYLFLREEPNAYLPYKMPEMCGLS